MLQIICACSNLVEVRDKRVVEHDGAAGRCPASGLRYVSRRAGTGYPGAPSLEVVAEGPAECPSCGEEGTLMLCRVSGGPDPNLN